MHELGMVLCVELIEAAAPLENPAQIRQIRPKTSRRFLRLDV
jgi:hypothetical protein